MLTRKMWRDLLKNKTQFISIFLMSLLGMLVFVGIDAESSGGAAAADSYYQSQNLCDIWVNGAGFSDDDVRTAKKVSGVKDVEKRLTLTGNAEKYDNAYMHINFMDSNNINRLLLYDGIQFDPDKDGMWVQEWFARTNGINIGDTLTVKIDSMKIDGIVRGIIDAPDYVYYVSEMDVMYPNYQKCGLVFMPSSMFPDQPVRYNRLIVDVRDDMSDEADIAVIKERLEDAFDRDDIAVTGRSQDLSFSTFDAEVKQHHAMGSMFSIVFLAIALLGIVTTMARVTAGQRTVIGTMKALGFKKSTITMHYISYGFVISTIGCITGAWIGYVTMPPWILGMFEGSYLIPNLKGKITATDIYATCLAIAVSTLVSFLSCRKELRDMPAVTLKPPAPKKVRHSALEKSRLWLKLDFATQWNIRDVFRNKMRSLMGIMGVLGCAMLLECGFGCFDSINGLMDKMYGELMTADNKILLSSDAGAGYAYDLSNKYKGQMIQESSVEFMSGDVKKSGTATIVDEGNYVHIQDSDFRSEKLSDSGIAMTYKMANLLGLKAGDRVKWHFVGDDKWQNSRIAQIYRDPSIQGITMRRKVYESMEYTFRPTSVLTNMTVPSDITDDDEVSSILNVAQMKSSFQETMEMMNAMVYIMVIAAVLLGVVVLYNLGVLSFVEKTREVATLKVLGFNSSAIRRILQKQNIWLTSIGIVFGLYVGWVMLYVICTTVSETLDMYPIISVATYIYSIAGTFAVSVAVNFMFSKKVKTIDMVDALKGVE
ncbi:MAG: FtsX-like permease family protein [Lachnospiraceae bacterium]|nr:FtsX-like permease family protein [Lachnospiraceae bacterium]